MTRVMVREVLCFTLTALSVSNLQSSGQVYLARWRKLLMQHFRGSREGMQAPRGEFRSTASRKWVLLSPSQAVVPSCFGRVHIDATRRDKLLDAMQTLRGRVYLEDGAIEAGHLTNGKHRADVDELSWHLLVVDQDDRVCGCVRHH